MKATAIPSATLELVSPYFVPARPASKHFAALARRGVQVRVLTNSLEATDVAAVTPATRSGARPCSRPASRSSS